MNDILTLPDGTQVGTGLQLPVMGFVSSFPTYESSGPMLSRDEIVNIAKSNTMRGSTRFGDDIIKDQRSFGSCNGFAGALCLTRARIRRGLTRIDLSGAYLYSLINGGRDQGSLLEDGMRTMQEKGIATESTVPWNAIYPSRYDKQKADAEAARFKGFECYSVRKELELFSALALGFDCVVAVHADNGFMQLDSRGVAGGGNGPGNHSVGADGLWWDNELIADGFNSWNLTYGNRGRMGLTWNRHFASTTKYHVFFAIRSTSDDPQGDNPPVSN